MACRHLMLLAATMIALGGCARNEQTVIRTEKHLTVFGQRSDVERFAVLQRSLRPALEMTILKPFGDSLMQATVTLPAGYTGQDLIHTTREALAANLNYAFEGRQTVSTIRS